ncbi:MAG: DUF2283 domain-containing protein [Anaerolineae bacterium]|nr:DUF2283 domain-containing protein [Anaerolineae bacterium]
MQMTYDHQSDAMYIRLTGQTVSRSSQINPNFALDLDANGEVIGIELLNVRKSGIDPLALEVLHQTTATAEVERPDPEVIRHGRAARMEALKLQRKQEIQDA